MDRVTAVFSLSPFIGILACVFVHVLVARTAPKLPRLHGIAGGVLAGLGVVAGMAAIFAGRNAASMSAADRWGAAGVWTLAYLFLAYSYGFGFFNLGESARRVRLLIELHAAGEQGMTLGQVLTAYNARMIVEARLQRLLSAGQIVERGGRYFMKRPWMLRVAKILVLLKRLFLGRESEFDGKRTASCPPDGSGRGSLESRS